MDLGPHAVFIVGSYAATGAIVGGLIAWIAWDRYRLKAQLQRLGKLKAGAASTRKDT